MYLCCLCLMSVTASAQEVTNKSHVDTLSLKERLTFRTNMVDWTMLVPNIGVEFDIRKENWNRRTQLPRKLADQPHFQARPCLQYPWSARRVPQLLAHKTSRRTVSRPYGQDRPPVLMPSHNGEASRGCVVSRSIRFVQRFFNQTYSKRIPGTGLHIRFHLWYDEAALRVQQRKQS